jgi:hypothetical protein
MTECRVSLALCSSAVLLFLAATDVRAQFDYVNGWQGQLFPSYIVATATMRAENAQAAPEAINDDGQQESDEGDAGKAEEEGDAPQPSEEEPDDGNILGDPETMSLLGVVVSAEEENTPIVVEIEAPGILETSRWSGVLEEANTEYTVFPSLKFNFKALIANSQAIPLAVTYRVTLGDNDPAEHTVNMTLRSINDCPIAIIYDQNDVEDISFMFAAYVNEQHPFVDKILREALNKGVVSSFDGYQSGNVESVIRQVYAIWDALSRRDVRYSNITASVAENQMVPSQHVRLIDQSINNAQANCVDGSVLLASLLRKIDIEPALVLMPGHCYLAFALDAEGKQWMGLETTLMGAQGLDVPPDVESDKIVGPKFQREKSWLTLRAAMGVGNKNLAEQQPQFAEENSVAYQFIQVAQARRKGILPIAFDSSERFNSSKGTPE